MRSRRWSYRPDRPVPGAFSLALGLALLATACGAGGGGDSASQVGEELERTMATTGSFAVESECVTHSGSQVGLKMDVRGVVDLASDQGRIVVTNGERDASDPVSEDPGAFEQEYAWDGATSFVRVGNLGWDEDEQPADFAYLDFLNSGLLSPDPADQLDLFTGASDRDASGTEEIRGENATGYSFEFNTHDLADADGVTHDAADELAAGPALPGSAEVWVDGEGRARRVTFSVDFPEVPPEPGGTLTCATDYFDFGVEVGEVLPTAEEVAASEDAAMSEMTENVRRMYVASGATDEEADCLATALDGPDLYFSEPTTREEAEARLPADEWVGDASHCATEDRLILVRQTMIDRFLAGDLPDPWDGLFPDE